MNDRWHGKFDVHLTVEFFPSVLKHPSNALLFLKTSSEKARLNQRLYYFFGLRLDYNRGTLSTLGFRFGGQMSDPLQKARDAFLKKLSKEIECHSLKRIFDAALYQFLVIGSAIAGFAALALGLIARDKPEYAIWAGAVGALTSVATILSQQLYCVKAVNWHDRMSVELDVIRDKFLFKHNSTPNDVQLAELTEEVAQLKMRMLEAWERITSNGPTAFGRIKNSPKAP